MRHVPHVPAKITRPRTSGVLARPRLFARLDALRKRGSAVWVTGNPGAGKTSLVASWIASRRIPAAWLAADEGDSDPGTFFHYVALAAQTAARRRLTLPKLLPEHADALDAFARRFFREVYGGLRRGAALVIDDCHAVAHGPAVEAILPAAVEELPQGMTLVLTSRGAPPRSLTRVRTHGALEVIPASALDLTRAESWEIARRHGGGVKRARVHALHDEVHGWATGFVLALTRERRRPAEPRQTSRTNAFEHFVGELFDGVDPGVRRVLLEAALLDVPTVAMVERITGEPRAGRILSTIARRGLFTVQRGATAPAYEFHALLREFLLARGREELPPGRAAEVRRAAATMLADHGGVATDRAISLLAQAEAFEEMAALVVCQAPTLLLEGRWQTVERWIAALPPQIRERDPWLLHWGGMALVHRDAAEARERLSRALALFEQREDPAGAWLAWAALAEAILFEWKDLTALGPLLREHARLTQRFPFPSPDIEARVTLSAFAAALFHEPDHPALAGWSLRVRGLAMAPLPPPLRLAAGAFLLLYDGWLLGELARDADLLRALAPVAASPGTPPRSRLQWLTCEATYQFFAGNLDGCASSAAEALLLADASAIHARDFLARLQELSVALVRAPDEVAQRLSTMARTLRPDGRIDGATMEFARSLVALRRRDAREAIARAEESLGRATEAGYPLGQVFARLALARARARAGELAAARMDLAHARGAGERIGSGWIRLIVALIEAEHLLDGGGGPSAAEPLSAAFRLIPEKRAHPFLFFSREEMGRLCADALALGVDADLVSSFVSRERLPLPPGASAPERWPVDVRLRVLGGLSAEATSSPLDAGRHRRSLTVLAALAALGGREVQDRALASALWPDARSDAAHHALETALYRLRRVVGAGAVVNRRGRLSLSHERCWVDVLDLDLQLRTALLDRRDRPREAWRAEAERIVQLYRGPLLPDEDAAWAVDARERLRSSLRRWLGGLAALPGDPAGAGEIRARLHDIDPALRASSPLRRA